MNQIGYLTTDNLVPSTLILLSAIFLVAVPDSNNALTATSKCGKTIFGNFGTILRYRPRDNHNPNIYKNTECVDEIRPTAGAGAVMLLTWQRFNIPDHMPTCSKTSVSVYIGCDRSRLVGTFCGKIVPFPIYSRDGGCIKIRYSDTSDVATFSSYKVDYKIVVTPINNDLTCRNSVFSLGNNPSGLIESTRWPYTNQSLACEWPVLVPLLSRIKIFVYDMKMIGINSWCPRYSSQDKVDLVYKNSAGKTSHNFFCRSTFKTFTYISGSNTFKVGNRIRNSGQYRGAAFLIGYMAYDEEPPSVSAGDAKKEMSISTILVIGCSIFGVLAFLGVSFMVVCRSRQMTTNQYRRQTEETGRLGLREINDPGLSPDSNDRLPQEFEGAQLSVAPPPSYATSLNLPTTARSTLSLASHQNDDPLLPSYEQAVHPVS